MSVEREKDVSLSEGVCRESLENLGGRGWILECRLGDLVQPVCRPPFEELEGTSHFFLEEHNFFVPAVASGISFRPLESICRKVVKSY